MTQQTKDNNNAKNHDSGEAETYCSCCGDRLNNEGSEGVEAPGRPTPDPRMRYIFELKVFHIAPGSSWVAWCEAMLQDEDHVVWDSGPIMRDSKEAALATAAAQLAYAIQDGEIGVSWDTTA